MLTLDKAPEGIERRLALAILRGAYAPGSRLPTVRELARSFEVNPATIQRAVARLETRGLITARQGSGLRVNDPARSGDLSLTPLWLEARLHDPSQATRLLEEFLELRRVLASQLLVRHRARLLEEGASLAAAAADLERSLSEGSEAFAAADLAFARALLGATGNTLAQGVLNTAARLLEEIPAVREAMYAEPSHNVAGMRAVLRALGEGGPKTRAAIEAALQDVDARTVARFEDALRLELTEAR